MVELSAQPRNAFGNLLGTVVGSVKLPASCVMAAGAPVPPFAEKESVTSVSAGVTREEFRLMHIAGRTPHIVDLQSEKSVFDSVALLPAAT